MLKFDEFLRHFVRSGKQVETRRMRARRAAIPIVCPCSVVLHFDRCATSAQLEWHRNRFVKCVRPNNIIRP